ncbi:MBL fold metallo-hydrolase [Gorillibacterium sp. CAU 1737]|uniref:MBL fold metallo-hydrolase n=1 Tax=Gorillibacterium sp. CAU 1737 TaxID=3140362 RepID=UPI0032613FE4
MSDFFHIHPVANGVWAAVAIPGAGALGNAAIVDLGNATLVVDTFLLPEAGEQLRQTAEHLTGRNVRYVVNTHLHGDHHYGNQAFPGSLRLSTALTREMLASYADLSPEEWQAGVASQIEGLRKTRSVQTDKRMIQALDSEIADKEHLHAAIPTIRWELAELTFEDRMVLHGSTRSATVQTFGGGHTKSDAFVYLPEDKVLIAGDLVLSRSHPAMLQGDVLAWQGILTRMETELDIRTVIPGHGSPSGAESLQEMSHYLNELNDFAKKAAASGENVEDWLSRGVLTPYQEWDLPHVFEWNFRWLYQKWSEGGGGAHDKHEEG